MSNPLRSLVFLCFGLSAAWAQMPPNDPMPRSDSPQTPKKTSASSTKAKVAVDRVSEESSSKDNPVDLSPPKDDVNHPGTDEEDAITELKLWDPHRAAKDVEVGQYYLSEKNYRGAMLRFRDALEYKPRDAEATYFLAVTLEKTSAFVESMQRFQEYIEILPSGPRAEDSRKGIERTRTALARVAKDDPVKPLKKD